MKYIDIHCHLDFPDYDSDRDEVLVRMKESGVWAITIGTDLEGSKRAVEIAEQNENVWACIGVHPEDNSPQPLSYNQERGFEPPLVVRGGERSEGALLEFEKLVKSSKVVGIGECGLDYLAPRSLSGARSEVGFSDKALQKNLFERQIQFAIKHDKPLMLHVRGAYDDVLNILENYKKDPSADGGEKLRGNVHFFAGDVPIAKRFLDLGFTMSFTGVITFTHDYDEVIKYIPINSIMSETDAPFVAPAPYRGKRNEPAYVVEVVKQMAEIRGENMDKLNNSIIENFKRIFGVQNV